MSSKATIGVVIPAHQADSTLGRTLDSVLAQDFSADQIIVVADRCTDQTLQIAQQNSQQRKENIFLLEETLYILIRIVLHIADLVLA